MRTAVVGCAAVLVAGWLVVPGVWAASPDHGRPEGARRAVPRQKDTARPAALGGGFLPGYRGRAGSVLKPAGRRQGRNPARDLEGLYQRLQDVKAELAASYIDSLPKQLDTTADPKERKRLLSVGLLILGEEHRTHEFNSFASTSYRLGPAQRVGEQLDRKFQALEAAIKSAGLTWEDISEPLKALFEG